MIVCICNNVSSSRIEEKVRSGVTDPNRIFGDLNIASCCGACRQEALEIIEEEVKTKEET